MDAGKGEKPWGSTPNPVFLRGSTPHPGRDTVPAPGEIPLREISEEIGGLWLKIKICVKGKLVKSFPSAAKRI